MKSVRHAVIKELSLIHIFMYLELGSQRNLRRKTRLQKRLGPGGVAEESS